MVSVVLLELVVNTHFARDLTSITQVVELAEITLMSTLVK
jgi:hypothetical protein